MSSLPFLRRLPAISTLRPQTDDAWRVYARRAAYEGAQRPTLNAVRRGAAYAEEYPDLWADVVLGVLHRSLRIHLDVGAERVLQGHGTHLFQGGGLRVLLDLVSRPERPEGLRDGCLLALQAATVLGDRLNLEEAPESRRLNVRFADDVVCGAILDELERQETPGADGLHLTGEDADFALRVLGQRAAADLAYHPGDEQESAVVLLAFSLQRLAFAARRFGAPVPWAGLCDAWGALVAEQPLAPLGRPLNRLGRGRVVGLKSLWSTVLPSLRRDGGLPDGHVHTFEGWCVLVYLTARPGIAADGEPLSEALLARLPEAGPSSFEHPLARQALKALKRSHPVAAQSLAARGLGGMAPSRFKSFSSR